MFLSQLKKLVAPFLTRFVIIVAAIFLTSIAALFFSLYFLILDLHTHQVSNFENDLFSLFRFVFLLAVPICILLSFVLARATLGPIREVVMAMRKIERGSLSTRIPSGSVVQEIEELKQISNRMLDKIEGLVSGLKEAFDHLAHDIRTPMTRLRGRAELALSEQRSDESYRDALQSCYENSDKILHFLDILTDITEAENRSKRLRLEKKYISDIVRDVMSLYEVAFEEKGVQVHLNLAEGDWAFVDPRLISRVVANLLDNAFKYTPVGGEVKIETINFTETVKVRVSDSGPGIAASEQKLIWEKLYRSDKSRSEHGMGLGLTFVKVVVEAHDGKVSVESPIVDFKGTAFEVLLQKMS